MTSYDKMYQNRLRGHAFALDTLHRRFFLWLQVQKGCYNCLSTNVNSPCSLGYDIWSVWQKVIRYIFSSVLVWMSCLLCKTPQSCRQPVFVPLPVDSAGHCTCFFRAVACLLVKKYHKKDLTCSSVSKICCSLNGAKRKIFMVVTKRDLKIGGEYKIVPFHFPENEKVLQLINSLSLPVISFLLF